MLKKVPHSNPVYQTSAEKNYVTLDLMATSNDSSSNGSFLPQNVPFVVSQESDELDDILGRGFLTPPGPPLPHDVSEGSKLDDHSEPIHSTSKTVHINSGSSNNFSSQDEWVEHFRSNFLKLLAEGACFMLEKSVLIVF